MKEFFRPTKLKLILTFLLPFYLGIIYEISQTGSGTEAVATPNFTVSLLPYILLIFGAVALWANKEGFFDKLSLITTGQAVWYFCLEVILPLIVNYLLACLIAFIYYKIKNHHPAVRPANPEVR
ncbi:MAG: hypothetical protein WCV50_01920 [Patescibacteria group bacterium]|jgi:hypothetical protein